MENTNVYVVVSQTGTVLSRILKVITGAKYNHASIAFDTGFDDMYSFGRLNAYNPFRGGYVKESPAYGTFKRFKNTKSVILSLPVENDEYTAMLSDAKEMYANKKHYGYNYKVLFAASLGRVVENENKFYCSEYVRYMLKKHGAVEENQITGIIKPVDFLSLPQASVIYTGYLRNFK